MKIYLVGGAVRDNLLHLPVIEKDWVVVGATAQQLIEAGYQQVGKDFPVFLHPVSREEYALARTERKAGGGYTGFVCDVAPTITLEEDLLRRDLTINAMAYSANGELIDPYHGRQDLENRLLRHVSAAFSEDPLRVLRVARFAARFAHLGFVIVPETARLMKKIVQSNELSLLATERVWKETEKALRTQSPHIYFSVLSACGALNALFPEIHDLFSTVVATGGNALLPLANATRLSEQVAIRFAVLCHNLGSKSLPEQPASSLPPADHNLPVVAQITQFCQRLAVPNKMRELAQLVAQHHKKIALAYNLPPEALLNVFNAIDVWRHPERLEQIIIASEAIARGEGSFTEAVYSPGDYFRAAFTIARAVSVADVISAGFEGAAIRDALQHQRQQALFQWQQRDNRWNK